MLRMARPLLILFLYFPPRPRGPAPPDYLATCASLTEWAMAEILCRPSVAPIVFSDVNAEFGNPERGVELTAAEKAMVSPSEPRPERAVATMCRRFAAACRMAIATTWWTIGPTFYGSQRGTSSKIDHIFLPTEWLGAVESLVVMTRVGSRLQHASVGRPLDHMPVRASIMLRDWGPEAAPQKLPRPHPQALRDMLLLGRRREEFLAAVEAALEAKLPAARELYATATEPDALGALLEGVLRSAAVATLEAAPEGEVERRAMAEILGELLQRRRDLRQRRNEAAGDEEEMEIG